MNIHVERAKVAASVLDSNDPEKTAYQQFYDAWLAWEAEDPTRTMEAFSREVGRGHHYTGRIVQIVTGRSRASAWGSGTNKRAEVAAAVLSNPETAERVLRELPQSTLDCVDQIEQRITRERTAAQASETDVRSRKPTTGDLMGSDPFEPTESWSDQLIIGAAAKMRDLNARVERWGLVLGSLSTDDALTYLEGIEAKAAELRAVLQERINDVKAGAR